ncbi:MAG TPA: hypothetical protein VH518_09735, partial [Tepidisphaeraceae bacterium]
PPEYQGRGNTLMLLCLAIPIFVALTGVLQAETARVWMFMLPLWALPLGIELARWDRRAAMAALVSLWLLTATIGHNMLLISP